MPREGDFCRGSVGGSQDQAEVRSDFSARNSAPSICERPELSGRTWAVRTRAAAASSRIEGAEFEARVRKTEFRPVERDRTPEFLLNRRLPLMIRPDAT